MSNAVHGAVSGTVLQVGTIAGDIDLLTGVPVRTRYRMQVKRIAPPELGREWLWTNTTPVTVGENSSAHLEGFTTTASVSAMLGGMGSG